MAMVYPNGLTSEEVEISRGQYGTNRLTRKKRMGFFKQFLSNFGDPIIKVLLAALAINVVFLFRSHDWYESIGIAVAVLLATLVSTISEYGSESAFEQLQEQAASVTCRVRRNAKTVTVPIDDLVVGDIVLLQAGEPVPADGHMIDGRFSVDQSALNGESAEVEKFPDGAREQTGLLCPSALFRGSVICSGEGILCVEKIGDHTFYGSVAREVQEETRESPLKLRLAGLAGSLSKLGFVAAGCVAVSDLFHSLVMENQFIWASVWQTVSSPSLLFGHLLHAAMLAITVVVVAVPEGLPMMITVVLSSNMRRMLKDHVLVRKLVGIETSGSLNILFTDKTGTLTKGKPEVVTFLDGAGKEYDRREIFRKTPLWELICLSAYYNTDSQLFGKEILGGNSTDKALMAYIHGRHPINTSCTVMKKIPFDSNRKWSAAEITGEFNSPDGFVSGRITLIKGAPDRLLTQCTKYVDIHGQLRELDGAALYAAKKRMEHSAMRILALALSADSINEQPEHPVLLGLVGLRDELRKDVKRSVAEVHNAGIQVVMMTGDSRETATAIAREAGLLSVSSDEAVFTSDQLAAMSDDALCEKLPALRVVARALPGDKSRLIRLAQSRGLVVGMTGDGINDAPALKKADVGFAMGSGTEVAKQASDIVILNDHFSSIAKAILYGRTIFKSIRKFIIFQLTMNLCAVGISVIGPLIGVEMPVTVMQMLWINIIMDTLAGLAFAGEAPLAEYMREPPKKRTEPVLNRYMLNQILCTGLFTIVLCVWFLKGDIFKQLFRYDSDPLYWMTAFFAVFIFTGIFNSFNARTTRLNLLAYLRKNPAFVAIMALVTIVQIALIYYGGTLFRTTGLTIRELLLTVALSALVLPFDWLRKVLLRLNHRIGSI